MQQVGIRFATAADVPLLSDFLANCIIELPDCEERTLATQFTPSSLLATPEFTTLLVTVDGEPCGFAVIRCCDDHDHEMLGIYIAKMVRRNGIGTSAARCLFDYFPGAWELRTNALNVPATAFWRAVADRVMLGRYDEIWRASKTWRGFVHRLVTNQPQAHTSASPMPVHRRTIRSSLRR